jgi:cytochrome P450
MREIHGRCGSDTIRNTISGGIDAMCRFPNEYSKLKNDPNLVQHAVPEIIRWQTPLAQAKPRHCAILRSEAIRCQDDAR